MFASHFQKVKDGPPPAAPAPAVTSTTADSGSASKQKKKKKKKKSKGQPKDDKDSDKGRIANHGNQGPTGKAKASADPANKRHHDDNNPRKRRRHDEAHNRRPRVSPEALQLSRQLQELSRRKQLPEVLALFWSPAHEAIRDNHHVCIVVDCCARCGDLGAAEKAVASLPKHSVSVETQTALLKGYAHSGDMVHAMRLFRRMCQAPTAAQKPNVRSLNTLLRGCLWTAATRSNSLQGRPVTGGVVSSEEAWALYTKLYQGQEEHAVDTSSYEAGIILLCQALRVDEADERIQQLQTQYAIQCKGKATIKGGDHSSLETCAMAYLSMARAFALLGRTDDMWLYGQRCLNAIQASRTKLNGEKSSAETADTADRGGKRGWRTGSVEEEQKRAASNLAYRNHRLNEVDYEVRALLKRRNNATSLTQTALAERLQTKLLYFGGGGSTNSEATTRTSRSAEQPASAIWYSFGIGRTAHEADSTEKEELKKAIPMIENGSIDITRVFPKKVNPIDVEIGSGFGDWIVRQAIAFPNRNHIAVELRADRVYQIFSRGTLASTSPLANLCTVGSECGPFLRHQLPQNSVTSIFCNHPEPPTQTFGQNVRDLEGIMTDQQEEPAHMLNSSTLEWASESLVPGGRIMVVTDNRNFGNLLCATLVRLMRRRKGLMSSLDQSTVRKMNLSEVESFPEGVTLYEGQPNLHMGHARDEMLAGQTYFDRLWKSGAGSHSERSRRFIAVVCKR
jgi:pentatricopeptide repeat protein